MTNREKKSRKIIFGSELFEPNNEPNFRLYQKIDKNREKKNRKIILGSEFSEAKNEPTFRLYQKKLTKNREKKSKTYFWVRIIWSE